MIIFSFLTKLFNKNKYKNDKINIIINKQLKALKKYYYFVLKTKIKFTSLIQILSYINLDLGLIIVFLI